MQAPKGGGGGGLPYLKYFIPKTQEHWDQLIAKKSGKGIKVFLPGNILFFFSLYCMMCTKTGSYSLLGAGQKIVFVA